MAYRPPISFDRFCEKYGNHTRLQTDRDFQKILDALDSQIDTNNGTSISIDALTFFQIAIFIIAIILMLSISNIIPTNPNDGINSIVKDRRRFNFFKAPKQIYRDYHALAWLIPLLILQAVIQIPLVILTIIEMTNVTANSELVQNLVEVQVTSKCLPSHVLGGHEDTESTPHILSQTQHLLDNLQFYNWWLLMFNCLLLAFFCGCLLTLTLYFKFHTLLFNYSDFYIYLPKEDRPFEQGERLVNETTVAVESHTRLKDLPAYKLRHQ